MRCKNCGNRLLSKTSFCLYCGERNAYGCGAYLENEKLKLVFIGEDVETLAFKVYDDEVSLRNLFEICAERIHERRVDRVVVSGERKDFVASMISKFALSDLEVLVTDDMNFDEFVGKLVEFFKRVRKIKKVYVDPEEKISGAHSTIIGGREGFNLIMKLARSPYVKKVVPGVIENKGTSQGGVRIKLTRSDDRGNIRALLIHGAAVQQIYVITTASNKEEGEVVLKELISLL
ncbi:Protein of unknown function DUF2103, metal-binding protein [Ferroglobus placidus DSM 10642]|uniref:Metal-binding protein n=1 Tax=Ferroglobus placidus (strain DSM 10642 / AEDII12DO) TaxID=589924 RepID=D3S1E3_FERPA|nr:DUF2103 domain-containing protein [Ferroglobus placidus]ADC66407.1 Protein of unknown function DUF2103, metal-binding protein [Ferroglobus placidus DSM 10642]